MIGILGGMGTQAGLDFCNKLAMINRGKVDQDYPLFILYNKSNIPGRPESIGVQAKSFSSIPTKAKKLRAITGDQIDKIIGTLPVLPSARDKSFK